MKYIIFIALLIYVEATSATIPLTDYIRAGHERIKELSDPILRQISQSDKTTVLTLLNEKQESVRGIIGNYVNSISDTEEIFALFKEVLSDRLMGSVEQNLAYKARGLSRLQNMGNQIMAVSSSFITVSFIDAESLQSRYPEALAKLDNLVRTAVDTAQKIVEDLHQALKDPSGATVSDAESRVD